MYRPVRLLSATVIAAALVCGTLTAPPARADPTPAETPTAPAEPTDAPPQEALEASAEAADTGRTVEITEWTDEYTQILANPDGTFTFETTREASRVKDGSEWSPIDTTVSADSDGRLRPEATALEMSFSPGGDNALATTTSNGHELTLKTPFALTTPQIDGNVITYPDVLPDVDLVVNVAAEAYSHVLVVKNRAAAQNPDLASLDFTVDTDLDYALSQDGTASATDSDGQVIFEAGTPHMWDSSSSQQSGDTPSATTTGDTITAIGIEPVDTLQARGAGTSSDGFTLTPPPEALTGPDVKYPVYIDPTWYANSNHFTVVRSGTTSIATGTDDLRVGYCNWTGCSPTYIARSYFQFNIAAFKPVTNGTTAKVTKAIVTLQQTHAASSAATPVVLARATGSFGAWTPYPGPLGSDITSTTSSSSGPYELSLNATAYVDSSVYHKHDVVLFALKATNESDPYQWKKFKNNPKLTVTFAYSPSTPTKPVVAASSGLTCDDIIPSNTVKITTNAKMFGPGTLPTIIYTIAIYKQGGSSPAIPFITTGAYASGVTMSREVTLPDGEYYVRVMAHPNITGGSTFASVYSEATLFTIDSRQPTNAKVTSTTHPKGSITTTAAGQSVEGANFTDKTGSIVLESSTAAGFLYSLDGGKMPTYTNCTPPSSGYVAATNGKATIPAGTASGDTIETKTLKVKAVTATGHTSANETIYKYNVMPAKYNIVSVEAENITSSTHQVVTTPDTSGGKTMQFTVGPSNEISFKFTPPANPAGQNFWQIQWDLKAASGQKVRYKYNGTMLGNADPSGTTMNPQCKFYETVGTGYFGYPKLEPHTCDEQSAEPPAYIYLTAGTDATFTIVAEANTVVNLDKIRFVNTGVRP